MRTQLGRSRADESALWLWGSNARGLLGDNTIIAQKSSPVQTIAGGTNWSNISIGGGVTAGIKTDGTLWTWGSGTNGELGTGDILHRSSPVQTITGGSNWAQVSKGASSIAAVKTDGTLWTWGTNNYGKLGNGSGTYGSNTSSPAQTIAGGSNWAEVSCGNDAMAAIKTDGTLWTWGRNLYGNLGDNTNTHKSSPVQTILGGSNWKQVSAGFTHTGAIKTDGTLWMWGENYVGKLGTNNTIQKLSPVQTIAGGTNWKQVSLSFHHSAAVKTDGTLWTWGFNNYNGRLGTGDRTHRSSPTQVIGAATNWFKVSAGGYNTAAIKTDGTLWTWGRGIEGQLGDNTTIDKSSPVQTIAGGTNWTDVSAIQTLGGTFAAIRFTTFAE
jgi:alpha-tubulin suppressor-like RCC1 family protein